MDQRKRRDTFGIEVSVLRLKLRREKGFCIIFGTS